jgi:hypothetical protein
MKLIKIVLLTIASLVVLLIFLVVGWFVSCDKSNPKRLEVVTPSVLLGNTYISKSPLVYINNLPRHDELSALIRMNSPTIFASEADREIGYLKEGAGDLGYLKGALASLIRIEYIPIGTEVTVVNEYIYKNGNSYCIGGPANIHYLIVEDKYGNLSEVSALGFRQKLEVNRKSSTEIDKSIKFILDNIDHLNASNRLVLDFCIAEFIDEAISPFKFIKDFNFKNEMQVKEVSVNSNNKECKVGYRLEFNSLSSYLTSVYYFQDWQLYGTWSHSKKI